MIDIMSLEVTDPPPPCAFSFKGSYDHFYFEDHPMLILWEEEEEKRYFCNCSKNILKQNKLF